MTDAQENSPSPLPPLRIHHFLVWMAVAAISISTGRYLLGSGVALIDLELAISSVIGTLAFTVLLFGLRWQATGHAFLREPGHGLLVIESLNLFWIGIYCWAIGAHDPFGDAADWTTLPRLVIWYVEWSWLTTLSMHCCLGVILGCLKIWPIRWQRFYFIYAGVYGLSIIARLSELWYLNTQQLAVMSGWLAWIDQAISIGPILCVAALLVFVSYNDYCDKIEHHWSHWCGVACVLIWAVVSVIGVIRNILFPPDWTSYPPTSTTP